MKKYSIVKSTQVNESKEFFKQFPREEYEKEYRNLEITNNKIVCIETNNAKIIKYVKEKGLT